jgi:hypothetical protein
MNWPVDSMDETAEVKADTGDLKGVGGPDCQSGPLLRGQVLRRYRQLLTPPKQDCATLRGPATMRLYLKEQGSPSKKRG